MEESAKYEYDPKTLDDLIERLEGTEVFEAFVKAHMMLPKDIKYNLIALAGETGESMNWFKKIIMVDIHPEWIATNETNLPSQDSFFKDLDIDLSDVFFYLTAVAAIRGLTLLDLMKLQIRKVYAQSEQYGRRFLK